MNKFKMVAVDLDGTTLNSSKKITAENVKAFAKAKENGICVVPVTGRPYSGFYDEYKNQIGCRYSIHTNGAVVMDLQKNKCIIHHPLSIDTAKEIMNILADFKCSYEIFHNGYGYVEKPHYEYQLKKYLNTPLHTYIKKTRVLIDSQRDFIKTINHCDNIYVLAESPSIRNDITKAIKDVKDIFFTCSEECDVEIGGNCSKGRAVIELAERLAIKPTEIMAIGDSGNDLNMLQAVGFSVAMENASKEIVNSSDYVTKSCENSGVAYAIEKFCF